MSSGGAAMPQWSENTAQGVAIAFFGLGGIGLYALSSVPAANTAEMTPAQTVAYRFPANWGSMLPRAPAAARPGAQAREGGESKWTQ